MKKIILTLGIGLLVSVGANADYLVYNNGQVGANLSPNFWWNVSFNLNADNPSGEGEVLSVKALGEEFGYKDASMGFQLNNGMNVGQLHNATLNFEWYGEGSGTYSVKLAGGAEETKVFATVGSDNAKKWNKVSLNIEQDFPAISKAWNNNENDGNGDIFSVVLTNGAEGDVIYVNNVYYSNVDESWKAPEVTLPEPTSVPTPTTPASDVMSFFSSYGNNVSFQDGYWGGSTSMVEKEIDGNKVLFIRNLQWQGLVGFNIDISDYDYMHVDYWTNSEGSPFGYVPISLNPPKDTPIWDAPEVKANQWNSYDAPLEGFDADLSAIEQLKFVANQADGTTPYAYIANIYFWKDTNGGGDDDDDKPGEGGSENTGTSSATLTNCWLDGTPETERVDVDVTLNYVIDYNEDKTLTITVSPVGDQFGKIVGVVPQIFIDGAYAGNFSDTTPYTYTTTTEYEIGDEVNMNFYVAYAGGSASFPEFTYKVDITNAVEGIVVEAALVDIYNLGGVRVAKSVNFEEVKNSLAPGFYIVGGKKVIVK